MIEVSDEDVLETLREVVAGREEFVYETPGNDGRCYYVHYSADGNKAPGCLVGHVLHRLGGSLTGMESAEFEEPSGASSAAGIQLTYRSELALAMAQEAQDSGLPWGEALSEAEAEFGA